MMMYVLLVRRNLQETGLENNTDDDDDELQHQRTEER